MKHYLALTLLSIAAAPALALSGAPDVTTPQFCYGGKHQTVAAARLAKKDVVISNATPLYTAGVSTKGKTVSVKFRNLLDGRRSRESFKSDFELVKLVKDPEKQKLGCKYS